MTAGAFDRDHIALAEQRQRVAALAAERRAARLTAAREREDRLFTGADRLTRRLAAAVQPLTRPHRPRHGRAIAPRDTF